MRSLGISSYEDKLVENAIAQILTQIYEPKFYAESYGLTKKSGWYEEDGGYRYYNGDTGNCVCNDWAKVVDKWYWFHGAGMMVTNVWYLYNDNWFYLGRDGAMVKGLLQVEGKGTL